MTKPRNPKDSTDIYCPSCSTNLSRMSTDVRHLETENARLSEALEELQKKHLDLTTQYVERPRSIPESEG